MKMRENKSSIASMLIQPKQRTNEMKFNDNEHRNSQHTQGSPLQMCCLGWIRSPCCLAIVIEMTEMRRQRLWYWAIVIRGTTGINRSTSTSHKTARTVSEGRCVPIVGCPRPLLCCESCTWGREMWVGLVQTPPWSSSTRRRVAEHWVKKKRKWCCCWEAWVEASMRRDTGRMEVQSCRWLGWLAGVGTRNQTNQSKQSTERQETGAQTRRSIIQA